MINPNTDEALYVLCGEKVESSRTACKAITATEDTPDLYYSGNICVDQETPLGTYKVCGCNADTDCNDGYKCDTENKACVVKPECEKDEDCKDGYACNEENKCVEKPASTDIPVDCSDKADGVYCGSEDGKAILYYCEEKAVVTEGDNAKKECAAETPYCVIITGEPTIGACVECDSESTEKQCPEGKICGDANTCEDDPTVPASADPCKDTTGTVTVCSAEADGNYIVTCTDGAIVADSAKKCSKANGESGNLCKIDDGEAICTCETDADCDAGDECKEVSGYHICSTKTE